MEETSEIAYLEGMTAEMLENARIAKERSPETLQNNFERSMEGLKSSYYADRVTTRKLGAVFFSREKSDRELKEKSKKFKDFFEEVVFSEIVHGTSVDLPQDENGEVTVLSAEKIASKDGKHSSEATKHQGKVDSIIGSNDLVFANSSALTSRSFGGEFTYQITSKDCCVVPLDIADMLATTHEAEKYSDALKVMKYSKNIYSLENFKEFFATYCAVIFDDPKEALAFLGFEYILPQIGGVWYSDESARKSVHNPEYADYAVKVRRLYVNNDIVPPFSPEWQFKGEVKAKKVDYKLLKWRNAVYLKSNDAAKNGES